MSNVVDGSTPTWRVATPADVPTIDRIAHSIHTTHERADVIGEKIALFPEGCRMLVHGGAICGYGLAHPWWLADVPPLDSFLGALPDDANCVFIHDVAILPPARRHGAMRRFVAHASALAGESGMSRLALVSVYGTYPVWARCGFELAPLPDPDAKLASYGDTARYMASSIKFPTATAN